MHLETGSAGAGRRVGVAPDRGLPDDPIVLNPEMRFQIDPAGQDEALVETERRGSAYDRLREVDLARPAGAILVVGFSADESAAGLFPVGGLKAIGVILDIYLVPTLLGSNR